MLDGWQATFYVLSDPSAIKSVLKEQVPECVCGAALWTRTLRLCSAVCTHSLRMCVPPALAYLPQVPVCAHVVESVLKE